MLGTYFTFPELMMWLPLLAGIICFFVKKENTVRSLAIIISLITLAVSITSLKFTDAKYGTYNNVTYYWLEYIGNSLSFGTDGLSRILMLLTAIAFPVIFIAGSKK